MPVSDVIAKIVNFLRAGYPQGVPATDTFALLALLPDLAQFSVQCGCRFW